MIGAVVGATINVDGRRKTATGEKCPKAEDAVQFARRVGFEPDGRQEELLRGGFRRGIVNCSRRGGEATVAALAAVSPALTRPERQGGGGWAAGGGEGGAGGEAKRGREQPDQFAAAEWVSDYRDSGEGGHAARVFGCVAVDYR